MKVGDIVINPWVSREYNGKLNPCYATIFIGDGKFIDYTGRIVKWCMNKKVNPHDNSEPERKWRVIGNVDLKKIIQESIKNDVKDGEAADG